MNASISVVCFRSNTLSKGEHPLLHQVTRNAKRIYKSLGLSVKPKHWDFTKNKPKPECPNGEVIQKIILDKMTDILLQILELKAYQKELSPIGLLELNKVTTIKETTAGEFYRGFIHD